MNFEEKKYLELLQEILESKNLREDRTGIGTLSLFGTTLRFSLENNTLPLLTTKKMFLKGIVEELLFFLRGETDTKKLEAKGVNIWKGNTSREFLDSRGLKHLPEGNMGHGYGDLWRNFGGHSDIIDYESRSYESTLQGIDQIANLLKSLKEDPYSRRHIVTAWNPQQLNNTSLPPCHCFVQFYVNKNKLSCQWYQRSVDTFLGLPFNISSYAILTHLIAKTVGLEAHELIFVGGDTHAYQNHITAINEQIKREPFIFPTIKINKELSSINDIENLEYTDFELENYQFHPAIKAEMAV